MSRFSNVIVSIGGLIGILSMLALVSLAAARDSGSQSASTTSEASRQPINQHQVQLEQLVSNFARQYGGSTGLYVIDLSNNAQASHDSSRQFVSASLYKLFVAYAVLDAIDAGNLVFGDTMRGTDNTVEYCLDIMITLSDNACAIALGNLVGWREIDDRLYEEGYHDTTVNNYDSNGNLVADKLTTPQDVALLLTRLYEGGLLAPASTAIFMELLEDQTLNYALPTGLDDDISFAHKTGILDSVSHDAGFVTYQGCTLLVVMMTDGWTHAYSQSIDRFTEFGIAISTYAKAACGGAASIE